MHWVSPAGQAVQGALDAPGLVRAPQHRRDPVRGRARRRRRAGGAAVRARGQRGRRDGLRRPAGRGRARVAAAVRDPLRPGQPRPSGPHHAAQRDADGRGDGPRRRGPRRHQHGRREQPGRRTLHRRRRPAPTARRLRVVKLLSYGHSSRRSIDVGARHGRRRAGRGPAPRLGRASLAAQREYLDEFWSCADVELEGDAELQQAVRFALFHTLQAGARVERAGDLGEGPDRPGLRRPHVLGHRGVRAAGADLHRAERRAATRCAGATAPSGWPGSGPS